MPETPVKNKLHYDLKKAYYATATIDESTGVVAYGTPVKIPGAVSLNVSPEGELSPFRADGGIYVMSRSNAGYSGDMELARVPEDFEKDCLGYSVNTTDKTVIESTDDESKPFALLFEFDGDKKGIKHVLYLCYANRISIDGENPEKREAKAEKLSIKAVPRPDKKVKAKTGDETTTAVESAWYTSVYEPTA